MLLYIKYIFFIYVFTLFYNKYVILLYCLYYFIVLKVKIKPLILDIL